MLRSVTAALAALLCLAGTAQAALQPSSKTLYRDGHDGRYLLDGEWLFKQDPGDAGEGAGFHTDPSLEGWSAVTVPHAWNAADESDASQRGSVGWYRRDFQLPSSARSLDWKIRFESANYRAKVWLNGDLLGEHEGAFVPFEVPALRLSRRGVNRLVVRVDSRRRTNDVPRGGDRSNGRPSGGWWNYGGLLREVYLRRFQRVDIQSVRVRTRLGRSHRTARIGLRLRLNNPTPRRSVFRLLAGIDGVTRRSRPISLPAGGTRVLRYRIPIEQPRLWRPGAPALYPLDLRAVAGGRRLAGYRLNVGIREIRVDKGGRLLINGRRTRVYGASLHEEHHRRGAALTPADRRRDIRALMQLNATIMRSHYPLHPWYLETADRLGLMVWDQVPVFSFGYRGHAVPGLTRKSLDYIRAMVERDWNHPSVLTWSIGNELATRMTSDQENYIRRAARLLGRLDPTRLRAVDIFGYPHIPPADVYHELDALGINTYFGWYPGPNGQTENRAMLGPYLEQMRDYYPGLALFVTEFGAESNRNGPVTEKGTYAFQRHHVSEHMRTYMRKPWLNGAIAWVLRDFRARPDWEGGNPQPGPPWNQKGLMDFRERKKPVFAELARLYSKARKPQNRR